jgi:hypothetical protein
MILRTRRPKHLLSLLSRAQLIGIREGLLKRYSDKVRYYCIHVPSLNSIITVGR